MVAVSRDAGRARGVLGSEVEVFPTAPDEGGGWARALDGCDAVVHLAGESIAGGRWTETKKARIRSSRVDLTRSLVAAMAKQERPPAVLVSGSAVGIYGDRADTVLTEETAPGEGFLAETAQAWEAAALEARAFGTRVALCRTGVVLGPDGGALPPMALPFRLGVGGPVGGGAQFVPWIHQDDLIEVLVRLVEDDRIAGPVVATAPEAVTNAALSEAIGAALGRRSWAPVPAAALKLGLGEASALVLDSLRCRPERLLNLGFSWRFGGLEAALDDLLCPAGPHLRPAQKAEVPDHPALQGRRPTWRLAAEDAVAAPRAAVGDFFPRPENLVALSPAGMTLSIRSDGPVEMGLGKTLEYGFKLGPIPLSWQAEIVRWEPGHGFSDVQRGGPYRVWWHEHDFVEIPGGTRVVDRVLYANPLGPLGSLAQHLFIAHQLRTIFDYRRRALRWRFGAIEAAERGAA